MFSKNIFAQLLPQDAFIFNAKQNNNGINIQFKIAKNYLMYKEKFEFFVDDTNVKIGQPIFPIAKKKFDENFAKEVEYYKQQVTIFLPLIEHKKAFTLKIIAQGCAEKGICYPPISYYYQVKLNDNKLKQPIFSFSNMPYKSAGLDSLNNSKDITPRAYTYKNYPENKKDYSKFYWLFIFMCIICTIVISHPNFNKDN